MGGGRLLDFVNGKRAQWKKLHEAATNPPPSSSLILSANTTTAGTREVAAREESTPVTVIKEEDRTNKSSDTQGTCMCIMILDASIHVEFG